LNCTQNTGEDDVALRLSHDDLAAAVFLQCANNTATNAIIYRVSSNFVVRSSNILYNTVTSSSYAPIRSGAANFSFVRSVIRGNSDPSGKVFHSGSESINFYLFECDVQAHSPAWSATGSTSMSDVFVSVYSTRGCEAEVGDLSAGISSVAVVFSCPIPFLAHLSHSFLILSFFFFS
jgi:hypothetical protein